MLGNMLGSVRVTVRWALCADELAVSAACGRTHRFDMMLRGRARNVSQCSLTVLDGSRQAGWQRGVTQPYLLLNNAQVVCNSLCA